MRSRFKACLLSCAFAVVTALSGCGESVESESVAPVQAPPVKAVLEDVAATGELGSIATTIRDGLTELKATDSAKADELLKDLDELETTSDPAQIKAKAKEMSDKL